MNHDDECAPIDANVVIMDVLQTNREITSTELEAVREHIASAPFDSRIVPVRWAFRGITYQDVVLGAHADSLIYHLVRRVIVDQQWAPGTTPSDYLSDLRRAVHDPFARFLIYQRRGGSIAAVIVQTDRIIESQRRGIAPLPWLVVIYAVERSMILTGYQFTSLDDIGIPETVRWLP